MSEEKQKNIYQRMCAIQKDIGHIGKNEQNTFHKFNFRGIDTVYNELHGLFAKHGVFSVPTVLEEKTEERQSNAGKTTIYRVLKIKYTFYAEDSSKVECVVIGEGMDSGDKAANKAMAIAHKYALLQVFTVPTNEQKDPDAESHDLKPSMITNEQGDLIWEFASKLWPSDTKDEIKRTANELQIPETSKDMTFQHASKLIKRLKYLQFLAEGGDPNDH